MRTCPSRNFDRISRQTDHALDVTLGRIVGKPKHHDVAAIDLRRPAILVVIDQLVNKDSLAVVKPRQHRGAFNFHRLHNKNDHQRRDHQGKHQIAQKQSAFGPKTVARGLFRPVNLNVFVVVNVNSTKGGGRRVLIPNML